MPELMPWEQPNDESNSMPWEQPNEESNSMPWEQPNEAEVFPTAMPWEQSLEQSAWDEFTYAFKKQDNITTLASDILESYFPVGNIDFNLDSGFDYITPTERYGEEFIAASPEQRRDMIAQRRLADLTEEYSIEFQPGEGAADVLGSFAGAVADPTSLIPVGAALKTAIPALATMGGGYSVLEDVAKNKEVDPVKAATYAGVSAVGGAALMGATKGVSAVASKMSDKAAKGLTEKAQKIIDAPAPEGVASTDVAGKLRAAGMNDKQILKVEQAYQRLGTKPKLRMSSNAEQEFDNLITKHSAVARSKDKTIDKVLGAMSTRVKGIDEGIFGRVQKFEFDTKVNTSKYLNIAETFTKKFNTLPEPMRQRIGFFLANGEFKAAENIMTKHDPALTVSFQNIKQVVNDLGEGLQEAGHTFELMENYFPRLIKDKPGLWESLGKEERSAIDQAIVEYAKKQKIKAENVSEEMQIKIANQVLRGYRITVDGHKPSFVKDRKLQRLTPEQFKTFYADPSEALHKYISGAVNDIERRKFFGRSGIDDDVLGSIGKLVKDANLSPDKEAQLADILTARFVGGEASPHAAVRTLRELGYMGTIANPFTAIKQLGDLANSAALNGFRNTISAMFKADAKEIKLVDLGLDNTVLHEIVQDRGKLSTVLNDMLKYTGFQKIDTFGKETYINAALNKLRSQSKSTKGLDKIREKWGGVYGDEFDVLIKDLQSGQMTPLVKQHLFAELAEVQPITMFEQPEAFAANPNARIMYMLKSFTLKQWDIVRKNIIQEWQKGNKKEAATKAAIMAGYLTTANVATQTITDLMLGREVKPEDLPNKAMWALTGVYGFGQYTTERYLSRGDVKGFVMNVVTPATPVIDAAFAGATEPFKEDPNYGKVVKGVPVVGNFIYNWFMGGAEKYNERQNK